MDLLLIKNYELLYGIIFISISGGHEKQDNRIQKMVILVSHSTRLAGWKTIGARYFGQYFIYSCFIESFQRFCAYTAGQSIDNALQND